MKKQLLSLMLASALALGVVGGLAACNNEPEKPEVPATGITLDRTTMSITPDDQKGIIATLTPADATTEIVWTTSDATKATVMDGLVTGINTGTAIITATAGDVKATCTVTVGEWAKYYVVGQDATVVDGGALKWDGDAAAANKDATRAFKQDSKDPHIWTITMDMKKGANFKITRFNGGWDPAIGASNKEGATDTTVKASGTKINFVDIANAPNIAVEDAGRYTFTLKLKQGGVVESLTYVRDGDIPAAA